MFALSAFSSRGSGKGVGGGRGRLGAGVGYNLCFLQKADPLLITSLQNHDLKNKF